MLKKSLILAATLLVASNALAAGVTPEQQAAADSITSNVRKAEEQMQGYYEHETLLRSKKQDNKVAVAQQEAAPVQSEVTFEIKEIKVSASRILSKEELSAAINFTEPKQMSVSSLQAVVDNINKAYKAKGVLTAQAILPPQTIKDGVVFIRLIEGMVGEVRVEGNKNLPKSYVDKRFKAAHDELLDLKALQSQLELYNNTNMHVLKAEIVPGAEEGYSDIVLKVQEPMHRNTSYIWVDNAGQDSTNIYRVGYGFESYGLGHNDDRLNATLYRSQGVLAGSISYDTPISHEGTRATFGYSKNRAKLVRGELKDYDIKAMSNDLYASMTHPLNVTTNSKVDGFAELHHKWSSTTYADWLAIDKLSKRTNSAKVGITARKFDRYGLSYGQISYTVYNAEESDENKSGGYLNLFAMRRQNLPENQFLTARVYAQYTKSISLPSTETLSIGGFSTVRGYKESLWSGDKGLYGSLEYNAPLSKDGRTLRGFLFYDYGMAIARYTDYRENRYISSTGLGLEFSRDGWYARLAVGVPVRQSEELKHDRTRTHFYMQKSF